VDRLIEFLNFLILATNSESIEWSEEDNGIPNSYVLMDPDRNDPAVRLIRGEITKVDIIGSAHTSQIDNKVFPSLTDLLLRLSDSVALSIAWKDKRVVKAIAEINETIDSLILRLG